jgi:hypothetical protein
MNIFEQLDMLLTEAETSSKVKESDIPIHPEMETKEQGELAAAEKVRKLFQKLKMGSGGQDSVNDGRPEIPDDLIDPMLKEPPKSKDKTFDKNKLAGWDEKPEDKIEKEVDVENDEEEDDEFDDFDYRQNSFGDEEDDEDNETPDSGDDDRSEDEKLRDSIEDAIDSLDDDKDGGGNGSQGGDEDDDIGANWGDEEDGDGQEGGSEGGSEGGQQGGKQGSQQGGDEGSEGGQQNGQQNGQQGAHKGSGSGETQSARKKRLEDLKKSLDSKGMGEFNDKMKEIKDATDTPDDDNIAGGHIETPTDEAFRKEMQQAGMDNKSIDKMIKEKNTDTTDDFSEEEMETLRKQVIDGLENQCKKHGGSALASTIVKNSLKRTITDEEWEKILEMFLKQKSEHKGNKLTANKGYKFGHKNHLWRGAVLPTRAPSKGAIQNIYCFVDFSGSVNQDLVFTFLGKVIDLCMTLNYAKVVVYGVGERLVEPRIIDEEALENGPKLALSQTWTYISNQNPGSGTTNFRATAKEINKIKSDESEAVILIFGDAFWSDTTLGVKWLRYDIDDMDYFDDICMMIYYETLNSEVRGAVSELVDIVGIRHIITSKASSIKI